MVAPLILQDHVENETSNPYLKQKMLTFHRNQGDQNKLSSTCCCSINLKLVPIKFLVCCLFYQFVESHPNQQS